MMHRHMQTREAMTPCETVAKLFALELQLAFIQLVFQAIRIQIRHEEQRQERVSVGVSRSVKLML